MKPVGSVLCPIPNFQSLLHGRSAQSTIVVGGVSSSAPQEMDSFGFSFLMVARHFGLRQGAPCPSVGYAGTEAKGVHI